MRKLFAITYATPDAARQALADVRTLGRGQAIALEDAVIVTRTSDGGITLDQSVNTTAMGAAAGALWGSLLGLIFLAPLVGAAVGAAAGALGGYTTDYGIDDTFMREMGAKLQPGTAALFVLSHDMTYDKVVESLKKHGGEVLYTSLPANIEEGLRAALRPSPDAVAKTETRSDKPYIKEAVSNLDRP